MATSKVYVIYTGGTLGMFPSDPNNTASPLRPGTKDDLLGFLPDMTRSGIEFDMENLFDLDGNAVPPVDSSDVASDHWRFIAAQIGRNYEDYDGFIVLHGTDTMPYTSSALSFMLENLAKPVVVTGSQLPIADPRSDAQTNFVNSLYIAGWRATGLPLIPEVVICFADVILRGNRARKMSTSSWRGFESPNFQPLGTIGEYIEVNTNLVRPPANNDVSPFVPLPELEDRVADFSIFPGIRTETFLPVLTAPNIKGIVIRTFGAGNAPGNPDFLDAVGTAVDAGKVVVNVTQCPEGMVEAGLYAASSGLLERGVISGIDMTPEAALTKLMSLLAQESRSAVTTQMQIDQRGEQSQNLFDVRYPAYRDADVSDDGVTASASPAGKFDSGRLVRAVVRAPGVGLEGVSPGETYQLRLFVNRPNAGPSTPDNDPGLAAVFSGKYAKDGAHLLGEVTPAMQRMYRAGRDVTLTLVPPEGVRISRYEGLFLALFTH